jgi:hemoglobin
VTPDLGGEAPCLLGVVDDHRDIQVASDALPDLATPSAIHDLVTRFYREIVFDDLLAPVFDEVAEVDWTIHIPNLIDYWCWIVLGIHRYLGSVTATHRHLHSRQAVTPAHCDRWCQLWFSTIDDSWAGPCADKAKAHAAALMAGMAKHVFGFEWVPARGA